jgi:formylglycine-generating enzyme required for sulfatase activity
MAAVPVSLPLVYIIRDELLKELKQVHIAEVFMSGLLQVIKPDENISVGAKPDRSQSPAFTNNLSPEMLRSEQIGILPTNMIQYEFVAGVRELLIDSARISDVEQVLEVVSDYIVRKLGISIKGFPALLSANLDPATRDLVRPFAKIATQVLKRLGGEYAAFAKQVESTVLTTQSESTVFEQISRVVSSVRPIDLQPFEFEVAIIELEKREWKIKHHRRQAWGFSEDLGNDVQLEMVAIPEGSFMMGSSKAEEGHRESESLQHEVTVKAFCMGKYPVTQAQWEVVAASPEVSHTLDSNPSRFKGKNLPVEKVSWVDAVEFCARLCRDTGKSYRLPSEAEWEYACRAGTTTPFHFGETITTDLANYNSKYTYGNGSKGIYREETTPVDSFKANAFGLYDMHGNVYEWCADPWHSNYEGAPTDGRVWDENDNENLYQNYIDLLVNVKNDNRTRLLRGGSWINLPVNCRAAVRDPYAPGARFNFVGFRLACSVVWPP